HDRTFPTPLRERGMHAVLSRRAHAVVTVSEALRDSLIAYERFPAERVRVIKNGVASRTPRRSRDEMRRELRLGTRPTAGIVARIAPVKNHALLLDAWHRVVQLVPDAVLLVAGSGPCEPELRAQSDRLGLGESVRFLGFRLDVPEL